MIAREGWKFIAGSFVAAAGFGCWPALAPAGWGLSALALAFGAFSAYFFRDPERPLPADASKIHSPADGTVLSVAPEGPDATPTVRIFMSPFNVHINRAPVAGKVVSVVHQPGSLAMAMKPESHGNERVIMRLEPGGGRPPLVVEQIAGFLARRVVCKAREGDTLGMGQRYGLIQFGSQTAIRFPPGSRPTVKPGEKMVGGVSVIGEWTE